MLTSPKTAVYRACAIVILLLAILPSISDAQARPDVLWMRGLHADRVDGIVYFPGSPPAKYVTCWDSIKIHRFPDGLVLKTIAATAYSVDVSPDGKFIAAGNSNLTLYSAETGAVVWSVPNIANGRVAYSPDGLTIASVKDGNSILTRVSDHSTVVVAGPRFTFSADGKYLISYLGNYGPVVFNRTSDGVGEQTWNIDELPAAASPDGAMLAFAYYGRVRIRTTAGVLTQTLPVNSGILCFSSDSQSLYTVSSSSDNQTAYLDQWDVSTGQSTRRVSAPADGMWLNAAVAPSDGSLLLCSIRNNAAGFPVPFVDVYSATTGSLINPSQDPAGLMVGVAFSREQKLVVCGGWDGMVYVYNPLDGTLVDSVAFGGQVAGITFNANDTLVGVAGQNGVVKIYGFGADRKLTLVKQIGTPSAPGSMSYVNRIDFSPDGTYLAIAYGSPVYRIDLLHASDYSLVSSGNGNCGCLLFSPDTKYMAWTSAGGTFLSPAAGGPPLWNVFNYGGRLAFSPNGKLLAASGGADGTVAILNIDGTMHVPPLVGHSHQVNGIAFTPDGGTLITAGDDGTIRFWNTSTGAQLKTYTDEAGYNGNGAATGVRDLCIPCDGQDFAYTRADSTVVVAHNPYYKEAPIKSLTVSPTSVVGGANMVGKVTLSWCAPPGGLKINLSKSDTLSNATVPASVTVAEGTTSAVFVVQTTAVQAKQTGSISATRGTVTKSATVNLLAAVLNSITLDKTTIVGGASGQGQVVLTGPVPAGIGGYTVSLSSSDTSSLQVPANVVIPEGLTAANFSYTSTAVSSTKPVTVSAVCNGLTKSVAASVIPIQVSQVTLLPTTITGGGSVTGTVKLNVAAPTGSGGVIVSLATSGPAASLPATVNVPEGATSAVFTIATYAVTANTGVTIYASLNGATKTATLTVNAPVLSSVAVAPNNVIGGAGSTGTVKLTGPVAFGTGGVTVTLTNNNSAASLASSVVVPEGASSVTFAITTAAVSADVSGAISATYGSATKSANLTVKAPAVSSLKLSPTTVQGGSGTSTGTVTLTGAAPAGGLIVSISSANTVFAQVPATLVVQPGNKTATFTVSTSAVAANTTVAISATAGVTKNTNITVTP